MSATAAATVLDLLREAGSAGMRPMDFEGHVARSDRALAALLRSGEAVRVTCGSANSRYYVTGLQPAGADTRTTVRHVTAMATRGPAIVPDNVRIVQGPAFRDTRYAADPSIAGRGQITRDWQERRLADAQRAPKRRGGRRA